jgi:hypothetical protein
MSQELIEQVDWYLQVCLKAIQLRGQNLVQ